MVAKSMIEVLKGVNLFNGLTEKDLGEIAKLCHEYSLEAGELCVVEGEKTDYVHFVKKGKVAVELEVANLPYGGKVIVDTLGEGEVFAWSALVAGILTASVRAVEPTEVLYMNAAELLALCDKKNNIGYVIMKNLTSVISSRLTDSRLQLLNAIATIGQ